MAALKTKAAIMGELQGTTYEARVKYAARLGRENRENPGLDKLVAELRTHPAPEPVTVDVDEGLTEVLKPQQRLTAKFYDEDQVAMWSAVAAQTPASMAVLEEELLGPCIMFNKLTAYELAKSKLTTDEKLIKLILKANPAVRKLLLDACVRARRVPVLDAVAKPLEEAHSISIVAPFLHGCSKDVIIARLVSDEWLDHPALNLRHMARFHADILVARMRVDLKTHRWSDRETVYQQWGERLNKGRWGEFSAAMEFFQRSRDGTRLLLELWNEYPVKVWLLASVPPKEEVEYTSTSVGIRWGSLLANQVRHFVKTQRAYTTELVLKYMKVVFDGSINWLMESEYNFGKFHFDFIYAVIGGYVKLWEERIFYGPSGTGNFGQAVEGACAEASPAQIAKLRNLVLPILMSYNPAGEGVKYTKDRYSSWRSVVVEYLRSTINTIAMRAHSLVMDANKDDPKVSKPPPGKDYAANYHRLLSEFCNTYCDFMVNHWLDPKNPNKPELLAQRREYASNWADGVDYAMNHGRMPLSLEQHPAQLAIVVKRLYPWAFAGQDMDDEEWRRIMTDSTRLVQTIMEHHFIKNKNVGAAQLSMDVFAIAFEFLKGKPSTHRDNLYRLLQFGRPEDRLKIWELFGEAELVLLGQTEPEILVDMMKLTVESVRSLGMQETAEKNYGRISSLLKVLLEGDTLSPTHQDKLKRFQDVGDHAIRKALTNATDSNSAIERAASLETLYAASLTTCQGVHMTRTMKFLQTKIKNESAPNRAEMLRLLVKAATTYRNNYNDVGAGRNPHAQLYLTAPEHLALWSEMLKDALESQDFNDGVDKEKYPNMVMCPLAEHPILTSFREVSTQALTHSAAQASDALFDFGVELQWQVSVFRWGEQGAIGRFIIDFGNTLMQRVPDRDWTALAKGAENQFVEGVIEAYKKRFAAREPNFLQTRPQLLLNVFYIVGKEWQRIPVLVGVLGKLVEELRARTDRDADGLWMLEDDDPIVQVFLMLLNLHGKVWSAIPVLVDFVEVAMRSRVALNVLFEYWLPSRSKFEGTNKERGVARDECVNTLLRISKSAIHMPFVWRHLVRWRQDIIDEYLDSKRVYPGVFYVEVDKRCKLPNRPSKAGRRMAAKMERKMAKYAGPGAFSPVRRRVRWGSEAGSENWDDSDRPEPSDPHPPAKAEVKLTLRKTMEREAKLRAIDAARSADSEHYFTLLATWGLHRLTPRQINLLAAVHAAQAINPDRSRVDQVKAAIRWTIMPTIQYKDVVDFLNEHEKPKDKTKPKMSVNVTEALIKGVMQNDEPTAPLAYLLSPQFLGSDRARVAIYMIGACIRYIGQHYLTKMLRMVLTGQRRTVLKVTAYKEVIRLLAGRPTDEHMKIIEHEWNREVLHRDIRITILKCCIKFLNTPHGTDMAWRILSDAVTNRSNEKEALIALVGAKPMQMANQSIDFEGKATMPRMLQTLAEMANSKVPYAHAERYARDVMVPIARLAEKTPEDDDLKALAVLAMPYWSEFLPEEAVELTQAAMLDFNHKKLVNNKKDMQDIYCKRWRQYASNLMHYGNGGRRGVTRRDDGESELVATVKPVMVGLCNEIQRLGREPETKRGIRRALMYYVELVYTMYPETMHPSIRAPMEALGDLFWEVIARREVWEMGANESRYEEFTKEFVHKSLLHCIQWPHRTELALALCRALYDKCCSTLTCLKGEKLLRRLFAISEGKATSIMSANEAMPPVYLTLCRRLALMFLTDNHYYVRMKKENPDDVIRFLPCIVETLGASGLAASVDQLVKDIAGMVVAVTTSVDFGLNPNRKEVPPSKFTRTLIGNIFAAYTDVCMATFLPERKDYKPTTPVPTSPRHALIIRELAAHLLEHYTFIAVKGAPEMVGDCVHNLLLHFSSTVRDAELGRAVTSIVRVVKVVESLAQELNTSTTLSPPTLHLMEHVVSCNVFNIPQIAYKDDETMEFVVTTKRTQGTATWTPTPNYKQLALRAALGILQTYPWFVAQRVEAATPYIVSILRTNAELLVETEAVRSALFRIVVAAFSDAKIDVKTAKPLAVDPVKVLTFIRSLLRKPLAGDAVANFAANLALDLLCHFGASIPADPVAGQPETVRKWRPDFEDLLGEFCNTDEGELQRRAWAVVTALNDFPRIKRSRWEPTPAQTCEWGQNLPVLKFKKELTRKQQKEAAAKAAEAEKKKAEKTLANIGKAPKPEVTKTKVVIDIEGPEATLAMVAFAWSWDDSAPGAVASYSVSIEERSGRRGPRRAGPGARASRFGVGGRGQIEDWEPSPDDETPGGDWNGEDGPSASWDDGGDMPPRRRSRSRSPPGRQRRPPRGPRDGGRAEWGGEGAHGWVEDGGEENGGDDDEGGDAVEEDE